jgi:hypothetical protein
MEGELNNTNDPSKKTWNTPQLIIFGSIVEITAEGALPPKKFGASDGVIASAHDIHWIS